MGNYEILDNGLIIMDGNPTTVGHLELMKIGLKNVRKKSRIIADLKVGAFPFGILV
jgi:hypothetical protein